MSQIEVTSDKRYNDEISLVDLASTFLRRRRAFYVVFAAFLAIGLAYALLVPAEYEYVSLVRLAEKGEDEFIRSPSAVIAEMESHRLPELRAEFRTKNDRNLSFDVAFTNPEDTGLLKLRSEAGIPDAATIEKVHSDLIGALEKQQAVDVQRVRDQLKNRMESLDATVELLKGAQDAGPSLAAAVDQRMALEAKLESVKAMESLIVSRQGAEPQGPAKSLIMVLAVMLGVMAGVFAAFFVEFAGLVREKMREG